MTIDLLEVTAERTPLDLLLWRHYRREVPRLVEDTLARNPGLAEFGVFLPVGARVVVKAPAPKAAGRNAAPVVSLYD
jgi:phage tail protein X